MAVVMQAASGPVNSQVIEYAEQANKEGDLLVRQPTVVSIDLAPVLPQLVPPHLKITERQLPKGQRSRTLLPVSHKLLDFNSRLASSNLLA